MYGPELTQYAEILLGDHDRAVAAVRSTLLMLRDRPELISTPEMFRDRLYLLVRHQCRKVQRRGHRRLVIAGLVTGAAFTAGLLVLLDVTDGEGVSAPPMALTPTAGATRPPTSPESPTPPAITPSPEPTQQKDEATPTAQPSKHHQPAGVRGRLMVHDGNCQVFHAIALPITCYLRLTAEGGPVDWSVSEVRSANGRIYTGGAGTLEPGQSASVPVRIRPTVLCNLGGNVSGTVWFAPGATATVTYHCLSL
ncbi:hypothetical protein [Actinomadura macra]|uniref:hypothetical protein n=1 Tax=Actinomadura macra TaxID=46164 RepID=UPI0012F78198|nr:hypothetical protein [Actinomadura macra]